jgi:pseudouridine kinase
MNHNHETPSDGYVLVIGAAGLDIVGRLKGDLATGTSCPAQIRTSFGGVARNVAENLARLGQPVKLITVVGNDLVGDQLLQQAASAGVDIEAVLRITDFTTGSYLAVVNTSGLLKFALDDMRAISTLSSAYIRTHEYLFEGAALLFLDANLPRETLRTIMSLVRKVNNRGGFLPVCADPTSTTLAIRLKPYLPKLHLITPNSAEAEILCGFSFSADKPRQALDAARCLVSQGVDIAVITLAEFGVCYATSQTNGHIPAIRTAIIDPTGAGDALTSAVLFALLNDISIDDAVRLGVSAATLTLRHRGAVVPDLTLEKLYDQLA